MLFNSVPISWKSSKQKEFPKLTTEAETIALTRALSILVWICGLLRFLQTMESELKIYCGSLSTVKLLDGQSLSFRSRHIKTNAFLEVRKENEWKVEHIRSKKNLADMMKKPGSVRRFLDTRPEILKGKDG
eukprot:snap_masked-scaffold_4-processed-gene-18.40-mRNA-1 protein AED:1.00 eAED:1.00 QI:0/0/0/0/1/1/2/0/130